jgi:hypothetical protein
MLGRLARELPVDGFVYEPKWDGFRCLAFRDGPAVDLRSRHDRPLSRYFPELVEALRALPSDHAVLDGEIVVEGPHGFAISPTIISFERLRPSPNTVWVAGPCTGQPRQCGAASRKDVSVLRSGRGAAWRLLGSRRGPRVRHTLAALALSRAGGWAAVQGLGE